MYLKFHVLTEQSSARNEPLNTKFRLYNMLH